MRISTERIILIGFFMMCFTVVGVSFPKLYTQYFDKTVYYRMTQAPTTEKKVYYPCENLKFTFKRTNLVRNVFDVHITIVRENEHNEYIFIYSFESNAPRVYDEERSYTISIPCVVPPGTYFLDVSVRYKINGSPKEYNVASNKFEVVKPE